MRAPRPGPRGLTTFASAATLIVLAACSDSTTPTAPTPIHPTASAQPAATRDYIVVLRDQESDVPGTAARLALSEGARLKTTWQHAIRGFLAEMTPAAAAELARRGEVAWVERDDSAYAVQDGGLPAFVQSPTPSWGLDRIDQRLRPLNNSYTFFRTASNVHVYIIDTGIRASHADFGGRVSGGTTFVFDGNGTNDCNGHGTHVSGTVGGAKFGVAKAVRLHPVRVFGCSGGAAFSTIISAVNWVAANKVQPAVVNMSLGGGFNASLNAAVNNLVSAQNVVVAVAAGNNGGDACATSPASAVNAITVGATGITDVRASFSNFGTCVDLFAPGVAITSDWFASNTATAVLSGTSMASPHVAGAAALLRNKAPLLTALGVRNSLVGNATNGVVGSPGPGSPNKLLFMGYIL